MKQRVLVWGAGMVAPPLVEHLLRQANFDVTVADLELNKAEELISSFKNGHPLALTIDETDRSLKEIKESDLVISLLPFEFHPRVAELCIQAGTDLITASYTSPQMKKLEPDILNAGILVLNEVGLDPGIDHMEAMRIIHAVQAKQGRILSFTSFCGGLPAPEANTNPLGYKFSWSPQGVLSASKSPAQYLSQGKVIQVEPAALFSTPRFLDFPDIGKLEGYPNRDSLPYISLYGIPSVQTMLRGTLRFPGWCSFMQAAVQIGLLQDTCENIEAKETWSNVIQHLLGQNQVEDVRLELRARLGEILFSKSLPAFEWLGLLKNEPVGRSAGSPLEALAFCMQKKLQFEDAERDMIVLQHRFDAEYPDGSQKTIVSTLVDYGRPGGHSAMARTVGLPVAVAAKLVLQGKFKRPGLYIPIQKELYRPILKELARFNIQFQVEVSG